MDQQSIDKISELDKLKASETLLGLSGIFKTYIKRAKNAQIWDIAGRRYIDFAGGIAVLNVGHSDERVIKRIKEQLAEFQHSCFGLLPYENYLQLAKTMNQLVPGEYKKKTFFLNSGAEAIENAVKIARYNTGRRGVISFKGGFHGRTELTMMLTGKINPYKHGFQVSGGDVYHIPYPARCLSVSTADSLAALEGLFKTTVSPQGVAAIVIELVQGEGGFYQAPAEFISALRDICDQHGILLIADEIQTGFGRSGKFFALEHYRHNGKQLQADIVTYAKSLAAGLPLSGVTAKAELVDNVHAGGLGGTYVGNPIAVAAALAVIDIIKEDNLLQRSIKLGETIKQKLTEIASNQPLISEVRGVGSMVAAEFNDKTGKIDGSDYVKQVQQRAFDKGLLLLTCGVNSNVIRFLYPLSIEDEVFSEGLQILSEVIV